MKSYFRRFFSNRDGKIVIVQRPNVPILVWAFLQSLSYLLEKPATAIAQLGATAALLVWTILEIGWGASPFRRVRGGVVLRYLALHTFW